MYVSSAHKKLVNITEKATNVWKQNEGSISSTVEKTDISTLAQGNVSQLFINSPTFQGTLAELVLDLDKLKTLCNDLYKQLGAALEENQKLQKEMSNLKKENTAAMEKSERIISEALASNRKAMQSKATTEKQLDIVTSLKDEYCSKAKFLEAQVVEAESERDLTINIMNSELKGMSAKLQVSRVQHVASLEGVKATLRQTQWRLQLADQRLKNELELREGTMRTADADGVEMEDAEDMENEGDEELVNGVNHEP